MYIWNVSIKDTLTCQKETAKIVETNNYHVHHIQNVQNVRCSFISLSPSTIFLECRDVVAGDVQRSAAGGSITTCRNGYLRV